MIKKLVKRILYGYRASSESYVNYLKSLGVSIGDSIEIIFPRDTFIDPLNPHLLKIGSNVSMTGPVTILTHDYSVCVLKKIYDGEILGKQRKTVIGNNVFLGWGCTILPGAQIGNNVVIGAGAVVSGKIEDNSVYAGNPAKKICSIENFYDRRKNAQLQEAVIIFNEYKSRFNKIPEESLFHEYFMLFSMGDDKNVLPEFRKKLYDHGNYSESKAYLLNNKPMFNSYTEFVEYASEEKK